ncbi:hypothetical protein TNCV_1976781 [Trichonephila clavipes]|nr:hypothetical protein TNCV_1976781 [Trichonephila clavipes]
MMKKHLDWRKNTDSGQLVTRRRWFSALKHMFVRGYKSSVVRRSEVETLLPDHIQQTAKHPFKQMFWGFCITNDNGSLVPFKGMMSYVKYIEILRSRIVL